MTGKGFISSVSQRHIIPCKLLQITQVILLQFYNKLHRIVIFLFLLLCSLEASAKSKRDFAGFSSFLKCFVCLKEIKTKVFCFNFLTFSIHFQKLLHLFGHILDFKVHKFVLFLKCICLRIHKRSGKIKGGCKVRTFAESNIG